MTSTRKVAYVAEDHGPKATLTPLKAILPGSWLSHECARAIHAQQIELLICGTSDTQTGRAVEAAARRAASELGVPAIVIEDFPGNYSDVIGGRPQLVFVESRFSASLVRRMAKDDHLPVYVCPSIRYDALRRQLGAIRIRRQSTPQPVVLWIGQPDTADSLETLKRLQPAFAARGITIWFRAHPRDAGYRQGAYQGLPLEDVTARPLDELFARHPALVATQFSSVAIEAGFWGLCALNVLFADLGGRTLARKKGYAVPPWCEEGAAFLIKNEADVDMILDGALGSPDARAQVGQCFDSYFRVHEEGSRQLMGVLEHHGFL